MAGYLSRLSRIGSYRQIARSLLPLIAALMLLAGCGEGPFCHCPPAHIERINAPYIQSITGLDSALLGAAQDDYSGTRSVITGLAPYTAPDGIASMLAVLDSRVYALPLQRGQAIRVPGFACYGTSVSLTTDADWLTCLGSPSLDASRSYGCNEYCFSDQIRVARFTLGRQPRLDLDQAISDSGNVFSSPTWRPDGVVLATIEIAAPNTPYNSEDTDPLCKIALYARQSLGEAPLIPALGLTVAGFSICDALQVAWSPDGNTLAVLTEQQIIFVKAPSPDAVAKAVGTGQFIPGTVKIIKKLTLSHPSRAVTWAPDSKSVIALSWDRANQKDEVIQYSLDVSQSPLPLFSLHSIGPIAYSADGHKLVFAYGLREFRLRPYQIPAVNYGVEHFPGASSAWVLGAALRPQVCSCPLPPTGIYACTLPTTGT